MIGIDVIWQLSLGRLWVRTIASFLRYTGYLNFINGRIRRVLLLILVHVQLQSCLFFLLLASLRLKTMSLNIAQQFMKGIVQIYFGLLMINNSGEIINKLKSRGFQASSLATYEFSTLYTTKPHNLIKEKLTELTEQTFNIENSLYLACNDKNAFLLLNNLNDISCGHVRKCGILSIIYWTIYLRFGSKLYRQIVGIPMGTNCAPLVAVFGFVMRKTSCCLCQTIIKMILLKLLTPLSDI